MLFNLYRRDSDSLTNNYFDCGSYETDAPIEIVKKIVNDIKEDGKIGISEFSNAVVTILKARGYACNSYEIRKIGYSS